MDLKEIIKWFIPCFHVLLHRHSSKMDVRLTVVCLFLFFSCSSFAAEVNRVSEVGFSDNRILNNYTKKIDVVSNESFTANQSADENNEKSGSDYLDTSVGRTFGRPFKKMLQAMIPLAFGLGSAATWTVVAALVGVKTLGVALLILKLLLVAGAAKIGALFASKAHSQPTHGWSPQKEIHLHIHNGQHGEEHLPISPWNREGLQNPAETKHINVVFDPYAAGPQTISTPYGHYMRIDPGNQVHT